MLIIMNSVQHLKDHALEERKFRQIGDTYPPVEDKMFQLGDRHYFAVVKQFDGRTLVHITKFYVQINNNKQKIPTKYGIALTIDKWQELVRITPFLNETIIQRTF